MLIRFDIKQKNQLEAGFKVYYKNNIVINNNL